MSADKKRDRKIVGSAHLVSDRVAELSEFEFGLMVSYNAFQRWIVRGMAAAGCPDLGSLDVMVLHSVNHRERAKKLADVCFVLNVEDSHTVTYALKKLVRLELVSAEKAGKETLYQATAAGRAVCERYREVREDCLVSALEAFMGEGREDLRPDLERAANLLRALSGLYDQAARAAASL